MSKNPETANNYWASRYEVYRANTRHSKCFKKRLTADIVNG